MLEIKNYITDFSQIFPGIKAEVPWTIVKQVQTLIAEKIKSLPQKDYIIKDQIAIHKQANIEEHVVLKGAVIISRNCFVGAHAYIRGGTFFGESVSLGPGCEVKSSIIMARSALAHFNFVGDSILGTGINMEAGSIICNHYNERDEKEIFVKVNEAIIKTGETKFGALVGDQCKIGANAVLSPGTVLKARSVVKRLELIQQLNE